MGHRSGHHVRVCVSKSREVGNGSQRRRHSERANLGNLGRVDSNLSHVYSTVGLRARAGVEASAQVEFERRRRESTPDPSRRPALGDEAVGPCNGEGCRANDDAVRLINRAKQLTHSNYIAVESRGVKLGERKVGRAQYPR